MGHKTLIDGTAYEISGGKTLVNGTAYSIDKGKTLVDGAAYEVGFGAKLITYYFGSNADYMSEYTAVEGMSWAELIEGDYNPFNPAWGPTFAVSGVYVMFMLSGMRISYSDGYTLVPVSDTIIPNHQYTFYVPDMNSGDY